MLLSDNYQVNLTTIRYLVDDKERSITIYAMYFMVQIVESKKNIGVSTRLPQSSFSL